MTRFYLEGNESMIDNHLDYGEDRQFEEVLNAGRKAQESLKQFTVQPDKWSLADEIEGEVYVDPPF